MTRVRPFQTLEMFIGVMAVGFVIFGTFGQFLGDTANSRLATVYALTQHGTWYIDRPLNEPPIRFEQRTIDKVVVPAGDGTRMLSSKPPILPLLMTLEYLTLNRILGLDITDEEDTDAILVWMTLTFVGLAYIAVIIFGLKTMYLFIGNPLSRLVALIALAFGTQLWSYSITFNNHVPAAGLLVIALYFALGLGSGKLDPAPWRFFLFGLTGTLVATIDMPAAIYVVAAGLFLVFRLPRPTFIWTTLGVAGPLLVHLYITYTVTGSFLPVQMRHAELYLYEGSYWRNPRGIDALNEPKLVYLFHMTIGRKGVFLLFPFLLLAFVAAYYAVRDRLGETRNLVIGGMIAFLVLMAYYVRGTNNYGGEAYGFRWYITSMPVLVLMGAAALGRFRHRAQWFGAAILLAVSFYSAWGGTVTPWGANNEWTIHLFGPMYEY